ncbi:hypothetical protein NDU88_006057 [Pleurodeles waltl]|uniref:Uncharacterized protein n=1 Tax=Pleurodeles waltl TaxID=8319 RepID=A0AAV7W9I8_PLEWA|nr:hypothetical protein NDU88_006057 [Pleurodeles waltl]
MDRLHRGLILVVTLENLVAYGVPLMGPFDLEAVLWPQDEEGLPASPHEATPAASGAALGDSGPLAESCLF